MGDGGDSIDPIQTSQRDASALNVFGTPAAAEFQDASALGGSRMDTRKLRAKLGLGERL